MNPLTLNLDMYTIGHRENYRAAIAQYGSILKLKGGYIFPNAQSAQMAIILLGHPCDWAVWEVEGNWAEDAELPPDQPFHQLRRDARILREVS